MVLILWGVGVGVDEFFAGRMVSELMPRRGESHRKDVEMMAGGIVDGLG